MIRKCVLLVLGSATVVVTGCGLLGTPSNDDVFRAQSLATGRLLVATNDFNVPLDPLALTAFNLVVNLGNRTTYRRGQGDYISPAISKDPQGQWVIFFGVGTIRQMHTVTLTETVLAGTAAGNRQIALNTDPSAALRIAYMDGSDAGGYNIVIRTSATGTPTALTSDASSSLSYWTPAFSADGQWVLYAKVTGDTGADAELWRVHPNGSGAEQLPITTTEIPTYATFSPDGSQVLVPGDFTSYLISDGSVGTIDSLRGNAELLSQLAALGYEFVGSPLTGPVHGGDAVSTSRHTFPISVYWGVPRTSHLHFDALVADASGSPPHPVAGIAVFEWTISTQSLRMLEPPRNIAESRTDGHRLSASHPVLIP